MLEYSNFFFTWGSQIKFWAAGGGNDKTTHIFGYTSPLKGVWNSNLKEFFEFKKKFVDEDDEDDDDDNDDYC